MAIPEHVKKQAMDAVNHKTTTDQIRLYSNNANVQPALFNHPPQGEVRSPIPDHVKKQAMDATKDKNTLAQVRLIESKDTVSPKTMPTPSRGALADRVNRMHQAGQGVDTTSTAMTKDNFGRECA